MAEGNALPMPGRVHHVAYAVKDHAATRHFYEDVLGMPLVAAWAEVGEFPQVPGKTVEYMHTFYALADGSTLAFFGFADPAVYEVYRREPSPFVHYSVKVDQAHQDLIIQRVKDGGYIHFAMDHGYVSSFYVIDPDGMVMEFCVDPENADQIDRWQRANARAHLEKWLSGDRTPNNDVRALPVVG